MFIEEKVKEMYYSKKLFITWIPLTKRFKTLIKLI